MRRISVFAFVLILTLQVCGQTDTLQSLPLPRVMDVIYQQKDSSRAISISNYLTKRARIEKDSAAVSWGHFGNYLYRKHPSNLPFLDSLIFTTKGLNNTEEIFGLITNAEYHFYDKNEFLEALSFYLKARSLSVEIKNEYYVRKTTSSVASIKFLAGEYSESLKLYHRYSQMEPEDELGLYFDIANCHYELKNIDSLSYYSKMGIRKSLEKKDTLKYEYFLRLNGVSQYMHGNYKRALDSLNKSRGFSMDSINLGSSFYYSALAYEAMGRIDSAMYYFKEITALNQDPEIYFPEIKNVYLRLYEQSKEKNNTGEQLYYVEKFIEIDSILESKSKGLISQVEKDYDIPNLEERKKSLQIALANKNYLTYLVVALSIMLILSFAAFFIRFFKQKGRLKAAINNPINYLKTIDSPKPAINLKRSKLPAELIKQFDSFFKRFELEKQFLNQAMSLQLLASSANTNTSYLSSYLNTYKRGYSNYVNRLRAQYAFTEIPKNPKLFIFTLDHIAKLYGFSSLRAFNRSFEKFVKIKPRDYLAQIRLRKDSGN